MKAIQARRVARLYTGDSYERPVHSPLVNTTDPEDTVHPSREEAATSGPTRRIKTMDLKLLVLHEPLSIGQCASEEPRSSQTLRVA